jgi:hypothetical protein
MLKIIRSKGTSQMSVVAGFRHREIIVAEVAFNKLNAWIVQ